MFREEPHRMHSGIWRKSAATALGVALSALFAATPASGLCGSQSGPRPVITDDTASAGPAVMNQPLPCPEPMVLPAQGSVTLTADPTFDPLDLEFDPITFELTPLSIVSLDNLGAALNSEELGPFKFAAIAHVEPLGDSSREKKASVLMASAIADYLIDLRGIDPDRISWSACGATQTIPRDGHPERRIVITNLGER